MLLYPRRAKARKYGAVSMAAQAATATLRLNSSRPSRYSGGMAATPASTELKRQLQKLIPNSFKTYPCTMELRTPKVYTPRPKTGGWYFPVAISRAVVQKVPSSPIIWLGTSCKRKEATSKPASTNPTIHSRSVRVQLGESLTPARRSHFQAQLAKIASPNSHNTGAVQPYCLFASRSSKPINKAPPITPQPELLRKILIGSGFRGRTSGVLSSPK